MDDAPCQTQQTADGLPHFPLPETNTQNGILNGSTSSICKEFDPPAAGMEFESYDDAYNYYSCYAREAGFSVRVKNSWFKRNSREKYGAVLCCSSQGFKRAKDVIRLRKETRTGCPAMMRMRLVGSKRWRILEVILDHNHVLGAKVHKPAKTKLISESDPEAQPAKLYRALVIDAASDGTLSFDQRQADTTSGPPNCLALKKGDIQAMYNYLCRMQLTNPNFFYLMDLNNEGRLRNVFWADARSRSANIYFGDAVFLDITCMSGKYEVPLVEFVGTNHHCESVLLGCGLLAAETMQSYVWLLKAWLNCTSGNAPQTIITDRCKVLQTAVSQVLPKSHHRFSLSHVVRKVPEKLGGLRNYDTVRKTFLKGVYEALKPIDFETAWGFMIQRFGIANNEWLQSLYEDRARWAPVYLKDTFFMGMATTRPGESLNPIFDKCLHKQTPLKEFLDKYELALQRKHAEEMTADTESRDSRPELRTRCPFELQVSKLYTRAMFERFQVEVEEMYSCFHTMQVHVDGPVSIFLVKERVALQEGNRREVREFEVLHNRAAGEVRCICSCFNFYGYLCRHALCVLNFNGVEEIPAKYILSRWKKDYKQLYVSDRGSGGDCDSQGRAEWMGQLYRSALQVVEEGVISLDHYKVALRALEESLERVHGV
ncbi:Protein FAR1-RELATED SEQUENCE 6 [Striga hermonthica]|uniref:Protein FAR1-RELATED SEQUENCE n=1 Tax=Striga hermonthica TaxID=68872 RepID=A0A9N7MPL8_STRHE|nr:Protein FAR1-RELATED SEQUENCE 6 [Striga hermonthica]